MKLLDAAYAATERTLARAFGPLEKIEGHTNRAINGPLGWGLALLIVLLNLFLITALARP